MEGYGGGGMSPGAARVEQERECEVSEHVVVKEEIEFLSEEAVCVKEEPYFEDNAGSSGVSEAAVLAGLYTDHVVKDELVLGPEEMHRPKPNTTLAVHAREKEVLNQALAAPPKPEYALRECSVRLERGPARGARAAPPPARGRGAGRGTRATSADGGSHIDEAHARVDYEKNICNVCGRIFALKSDLMKHAMIHKHTRTSTELEAGNVSNRELFGAGARSRPALRECRVRLARVPPRAAAAHAPPPHTDSRYKVNSDNLQDNAKLQTFQCNACGKIFQQKHQLTRHIKCHARNRTCDKTRNERSNTFTRQKRIRTIQKSYSCEICNEQFTKLGQLRIHERLHTDGIKYPCELCKMVFVQLAQFKKHQQIHIGERPYSCVTCQKRFMTKSVLNEHERIHTGDRPYSCDICKKKYTRLSYLNVHKRIHTGEKPYSCEICEKQFTQLGAFYRHRQLHTDVKPYSCDICNKQFKLLHNCDIHKRTHTGEKPYSCEVCKKRFTQRGTLNSHKLTHTGEKPYSCDVCKKKFTVGSSLNTHKRTHTGAKPYSCEVCKKKFTQLSTLNDHKRTHTGAKPYSCEVCKNKFAKLSSLNSHKQTHTGAKPYSCEICKKAFTRRGSLKFHIGNHSIR